ncbi:uncharacterized protein K02A2.6-like [Phymastichus coffea]|uniref:uncharacterized protein K02A2.6-like n=1 Tax=Phymastichus coffea TaxID=108790 RepID=UPI00273BBA5E|nr:uncharacterized protein K02A2.6-like [Phymastichus coffea]
MDPGISPVTLGGEMPTVQAVQHRAQDFSEIRNLLSELISVSRDPCQSQLPGPRLQETQPAERAHPVQSPFNFKIEATHRWHLLLPQPRQQPIAPAPAAKFKRLELLPGRAPYSNFDAAHHLNASLCPENCLHVTDYISGMRFLVDSGSVVSTLPCMASAPTQPYHGPPLAAANGSQIKTFGRHQTQIDLELNRKLIWSFILADVKTPILGADFLSFFGLVLNLKRHRLIDEFSLRPIPGVLKSAEVHTISVQPPQPSASPAHDDTVKSLIARFQDRFAAQDDLITGPKATKIAGDKLKAAKVEFSFLQQSGIIRPSSSPYASPLHIVKASSSKYRVTGDYRNLNAQTVPDRYPILRIIDLLLQLHGKQVFSTIDLKRAYFQIPVAKEDTLKTAITMPFRLFEFLGIPLGLKNASQTFQGFMHSVVGHLDFTTVYLDDVLVSSSSIEEHLQHLQAVFKALLSSKLRINWDKCVFTKREVLFLGFSINAFGFKPPAEKVNAIVNFPKPQTFWELKRFLGAVNYFRHHLSMPLGIRRYSTTNFVEPKNRT